MAGPKKTDEPVMVEPVTTAIGCWGTKGLIPVGTRLEIPVEAFSPKWMKLFTVNDKKKLTQFKRNQAETAAELAKLAAKADSTVIIHSEADKEVGVLREEIGELQEEALKQSDEIAELRNLLLARQAEVAPEPAVEEAKPDQE